MKITMYELLGMVKDKKELPKKVKVLDVIYEFDEHYGDYYNEPLDRYLFVYMTSEEEWKLAYFLNIQVEILEEKEAPEKLYFTNYEDATREFDYDVLLTINEIIDCLNHLKSKGDE